MAGQANKRTVDRPDIDVERGLIVLIDRINEEAMAEFLRANEPEIGVTDQEVDAANKALAWMNQVVHLAGYEADHRKRMRAKAKRT